MSLAYYNEHDPFAAAWLRELINAGHIAFGIVDERSIEDVEPEFLLQFTQCHFFAGIGVWSCALRLAGWPDDRRVWTGSAPCQPFSAAGKGAGHDDERHLWPAFHHLIRECRPPVVFGEQVEAAIKHGWLDLVQNDLEGIGYTVGAVGLPAACVGAPHIRQRLWFVADSNDEGSQGWGGMPERAGERAVGPGGVVGGMADSEQHCGRCEAESAGHIGEETERSADKHSRHSGASCRMADAEEYGQQGKHIRGYGESAQRVAQDGALGGMADTDGRDASAEWEQCCGEQRQQSQDSRILHNGPTRPTDSHWRDADWLLCRDGKWRPVEPGTFPLVNGASARVGRLRGYGNAIVAQVAQVLIETYMESRI